MAIAHIDTTQYTNVSASLTFNITLPASATTGRLMVLAMKQSGTTGTFTMPTGFTQVGATFTGPGTTTGRSFLAYKVAASGDAGAARTVTSTTSNTWSGVISVYSGADTTTPVVTTISTNSGTMTTTSVVINAVTMANANSVLFGFYHTNSSATFTTGTMTERADFLSNSVEVGAADEAIAASGTTGTRTMTTSLSVTEWAALGLGINPAAAAGAKSLVIPTETAFTILRRR